METALFVAWLVIFCHDLLAFQDTNSLKAHVAHSSVKVKKPVFLYDIYVIIVFKCNSFCRPKLQDYIEKKPNKLTMKPTVVILRNLRPFSLIWSENGDQDQYHYPIISISTFNFIVLPLQRFFLFCLEKKQSFSLVQSIYLPLYIHA